MEAKNMKDSRIVIPVEEKEHADIKIHSEKKGFDSVAAYIRWLIRQDISAPVVEEDHS